MWTWYVYFQFVTVECYSNKLPTFHWHLLLDSAEENQLDAMEENDKDFEVLEVEFTDEDSLKKQKKQRTWREMSGKLPV